MLFVIVVIIFRRGSGGGLELVVGRVVTMRLFFREPFLIKLPAAEQC